MSADSSRKAANKYQGKGCGLTARNNETAENQERRDQATFGAARRNAEGDSAANRKTRLWDYGRWFELSLGHRWTKIVGDLLLGEAEGKRKEYDADMVVLRKKPKETLKESH